MTDLKADAVWSMPVPPDTGPVWDADNRRWDCVTNDLWVSPGMKIMQWCVLLGRYGPIRNWEWERQS